MFSPYLHTLSVFVLFFLAFGNCRVEEIGSASNSLLPPTGWRLGNRALFARQSESCAAILDDPDFPDCRTLCSANGVCSKASSTRRNVLRAGNGVENSTNLHPRWTEDIKLNKRVLEVITSDDLANFLQHTAANDAITAQLIRTIQGDQPNVVEAQLLANSAFKIGTNGLCGCTVVAVVSTQAVYMGHFFEDPSWVSKNFDAMVLRFFGSGGVPDGLGPAIDPANFPNQASTKVFIMTPRKGFRNFQSSRYPAKVNALRGLIKQTLGASVSVATWNYIPKDCDDEESLYLDQRGVALFEYDPDWDGSHTSGWRLYFEENLFLDTDAPLTGSETGIPDQ